MRTQKLAMLFCMLCGFLPACDRQTAGANNDLVLQNVTIVSPERAAPLAGAWVAIRDGRIEAIGQGDAVPGTRVLDGRGRFLTPGLIDSHVHLAAIPGLRYPVPAAQASLAETYRRQLPRSYLYFGFTTLIDLNALDRAELERFESAPLHPDLYDCGAALVIANGYPMVYAQPQDRFRVFRNFIYDARQAEAIPAEYAAADHTPQAAVRRVIDEGGICVKTFWETGFGEFSGLPTPTSEMIDDVTDTSHRNGLTVAMHANSFDAYSFAAETEIDVIVHGLWNWGEHAVEDGMPAPIAGVLDTLIARDIAVMPTMQVIGGIRAQFDEEFLDDPELTHALPQELIAWYGTAEGNWFSDEIRGEFGGLDDARIAVILDRGSAARASSRRYVAYLAARNARFLFGSDTPSSPTHGNPPGYNGFLEMQSLVGAGMSLRQLFAALTIANARAFRLDDRYGTVEPGKVANLLLLAENPLETVNAWNSIETVILAGQPIERASLSAAGKL